MSIDEFLKLIENDFLPLLNGKGFQVSYRYERRYPHLVHVGLDAKEYYLRILFSYEDQIGLFVGTKKHTYLDESDWFYLRRLIDFVVQRPMRWDPLGGEMLYHEYLLGRFHEQVNEFAQYQDQIFRIFENESTVLKWETDFRRYVRQEIHKKYPDLKT